MRRETNVVVPKVKTTWLSVMPIWMLSSRVGMLSTSWNTLPLTMARKASSAGDSTEASQTARRKESVATRRMVLSSTVSRMPCRMGRELSLDVTL